MRRSFTGNKSRLFAGQFFDLFLKQSCLRNIGTKDKYFLSARTIFQDVGADGVNGGFGRKEFCDLFATKFAVADVDVGKTFLKTLSELAAALPIPGASFASAIAQLFIMLECHKMKYVYYGMLHPKGLYTP